jgi:FdhD protein
MDEVDRVEETGENNICIYLKEGRIVESGSLQRNFYTSSSCGVCGKASIDAIHTVGRYTSEIRNTTWTVKNDILRKLPENLRRFQETFERTGGIHASALFSAEGEMICLREDVGRHNALDKLAGWGFRENRLPFKDCILLLSGRGSFELLQKSAMAGISMVAAVGAPSSLAIETARQFGITLAGFLSENRFNIYAGSKRII